MSGERVEETHDAPTLKRYNEFKSAFQGNDGNKIVSYLRAKGVCGLYLTADDPLAKTLGIHEKIVFKNAQAMVIDLR